MPILQRWLEKGSGPLAQLGVFSFSGLLSTKDALTGAANIKMSGMQGELDVHHARHLKHCVIIFAAVKLKGSKSVSQALHGSQQILVLQPSKS